MGYDLLHAGFAPRAWSWRVVVRIARPIDRATLALAPASLAVIALAASLLPARRAASLDPMAALHDEEIRILMARLLALWRLVRF
jgi:hypothetical protein